MRTQTNIGCSTFAAMHGFVRRGAVKHYITKIGREPKKTMIQYLTHRK